MKSFYVTLGSALLVLNVLDPGGVGLDHLQTELDAVVAGSVSWGSPMRWCTARLGDLFATLCTGTGPSPWLSCRTPGNSSGWVSGNHVDNSWTQD